MVAAQLVQQADDCEKESLNLHFTFKFTFSTAIFVTAKYFALFIFVNDIKADKEL